MDIVRFTIHNPVKVAVGVILICLFGGLALFQIPIQLTPNVDQPQVTVTTRWPGRSAREVEREIVDRQEEKLKGISGLRKMRSTCSEGQAVITLEFFIGVDKDAALRETDSKINQVSGYPDEVEKPEVVAADAAMESPIAWILLKADDGSDVSIYRDFVWDNVKPMLERVEGLSSVNVFGGREREVHILADPALLAARGITLREFEAALKRQNVNASAGTVATGKRDFIFRTVGQFETVEEVENTIVAYRQGGPVCVRDVARVVRTHEKPREVVRSKGEPVLALPAYRETGANVIEVMAGLRRQIETVNREVLRGRGLSLELTQVYDETVYIDSAIGLVQSNIVVGGVLTVAVLLVFLRNLRATAIVALSIPISVIGAFLAVSLLGRSLNVVMLAGMAFAVGMVVDNAIVVLENIYRHRQMGKPAFQAAQDGATEVWGAVLASTLTTMVVFIPVVFVKEEAGQLFGDIAIAISAGVLLSMLVSVLVIPTLAARLLGGRTPAASRSGPAGEETAPRYASLVADAVARINRSWPARLAVVAVFLVGSLVGSWALIPPTDYLPTGNRNLILGFVITEPGLNTREFTALAEDIERYLRPYWTAAPGSAEAAALPPVPIPAAGGRMVPVTPPLIENFFFVAFNNSVFMGATSRDPLRVKPLAQIMTQAAMSSPRAIGAIPIFFQTGLFGGVRASGTVEVEIRSESLAAVNEAAGLLFMNLMQEGLTSVRPEPINFDLPRPEVRAVPLRARAADVGLSAGDIGFILAAAVDGAYVGGFREQGDEIDLKVRFENADGTPLADVRHAPVFTPAGRIVPLSSVARFEEVDAPQQINHIEEMPGVSLEVRPPADMAVETVVQIIDRIVDRLRRQGAIPPGVFVSLAGNADKLAQTREAMFGHFSGLNAGSVLAVLQSRGFLALVVVYLLMAGLFESFVHPVAILLSVPLAAIGGFAGLRVVHTLSLTDPTKPVQQLDVVTMLGFIILLGIVVNNAILIVHQTLNNLDRGLDPAQALHESVRSRIRPIFMTAFTSIGGMLPLALMPGAGSELYRGLAAVMCGGLLVSTLFTLLLVPVVYSVFLSLRLRLVERFGREDQMPVGAAAGRHGPAPHAPPSSG